MKNDSPTELPSPANEPENDHDIKDYPQAEFTALNHDRGILTRSRSGYYFRRTVLPATIYESDEETESSNGSGVFYLFRKPIQGYLYATWVLSFFFTSMVLCAVLYQTCYLPWHEGKYKDRDESPSIYNNSYVPRSKPSHESSSFPSKIPSDNPYLSPSLIPSSPKYPPMHPSYDTSTVPPTHPSNPTSSYSSATSSPAPSIFFTNTTSASTNPSTVSSESAVPFGAPFAPPSMIPSIVKYRYPSMQPSEHKLVLPESPSIRTIVLSKSSSLALDFQGTNSTFFYVPIKIQATKK